MLAGDVDPSTTIALSFFRQTEKKQLEPAPGLTAGQIVGDFRLTALIGQGGMGQVWEAEQLSLGGRRVALKFVRPERVTERQLELFAREARAGGRLSHPGIVAVYGHGISAGLAWIGLEFVKGCWTLRDFLNDVARASEVPEGYDRQVARFIAEIADAMQAAHEAGVIHRDLKPQNVLITSDNRPKITDFGLARITDESAISASGEFAGTYFYMSPEQVLAKRMGIDHRTDVFSLGVVLYELLALQRPFQGDTGHQVVAQIATKDPPDPRTFRSRIPRDLVVIAGKALEKDRDKRFPMMKELAADLRRYLAGEPIHARPPSRLDHTLKWIKRNPAKSSVTAVVLLALVVISTLLVENVRARGEADDRRREAEQAAEREKLAAERERTAADLAQANERRATDEKDRADHEAQAATKGRDEVLQLSALQDLDDLLARADELWPASPERIKVLEDWIRDARALVADLPVHERKRRELRAKALPQPADEREVKRKQHPDYPRWVELEKELETAAVAAVAATSDEAARAAEEQLVALEQERDRIAVRLDDRRDWTFPEEEREARWWNNQLTKLIEGLDELEKGLLVEDATSEAHGWSVPRRLAFARSLEAGFAPGGEHERRWSVTLPEIRAAYPGIEVTPQLGLVPIGLDPDSGLWEFAHLQTGEPAERGPDGKLVLREETGLVFVLLPGGTFWMGAQKSDPAKPNYDPSARREEGPVHEVTLSPFFLSKYEMTQAQWLSFTGSNPSAYQLSNLAPSLLHPVEQVSWTTCTEVCKRLGLELPSEAQWEYGERGGTGTAWWTGDERDSLLGAANLADQAAKRTAVEWQDIKDWPELDDGYPVHAPVNQLAANPYGLYHVHGNVWEWCRDGYHGGDFYYRQTSGTDPVSDPAGASSRVYRGGGFTGAALAARSACRGVIAPGYASDVKGVRPARALLAP